MRVLLVVRPCQGGMVTHIRTLVNGLRKAGHQVYLAGPVSLGSEKTDGFFLLPLAAHPHFGLGSARTLKQIIMKLQPHVVHFHGALAALTGRFIRRRSCPFVYTVHNFPGGSLPGLAWREAWLAHGFKNVITVSEALASTLVKHGVPKEKVRAIPNGVTVEPSLNATIPEPHSPYILSVGRLVPVKGMSYLLHAFARLKRWHQSGLRLVIAGEGPQRPQLERLARGLGIDQVVEFKGFVTDPYPLLAQACLFVTAPLKEGMGLANLEAMAAARPVISTRVGGIPEVVADGETGILVRPRRPDELASAMDHLLCQPDLAAELGRAGARRVKEHFNGVKMITSTLQVYEEARVQ